VHPIQVDVVGLQSFQTGFHRLHHVLAVISRGIRIVAGHSEGVFRRQHNAVAMALHELSEEFLARAISVEIRRVNEVSACLAVGLIDFLRFRLW
jgi:hypothetical protein